LDVTLDVENDSMIYPGIKKPSFYRRLKIQSTSIFLLDLCTIATSSTIFEKLSELLVLIGFSTNTSGEPSFPNSPL